ncbi:hypothetical protein C7M84_018885 [Penaeus vannamei]|uniref:Peptidase M60 domain-containing protein n=1 Tax=Penaeus vannamei TaxID=6689 RepID=A0A423SGB6_PENVA|nr:TRPM8 channel-associated factor homolog [Penaeus vannamei]ROT63231.1 hypothetical protein C7M84_018885 [Penaeus vannamei]
MSGEAASDGEAGDRASSSREEQIFLISQAEDACLAVVSGSTPEDAVVGLASVSNSKEKLWYNCGGQWQWGGDRSFCLAQVPGKPTVGLARSCSSRAKCRLDGEGRMALGSAMLTVPPGGSTRVILCPKMNIKHQKWWTAADLKSNLQELKSAVYPFPAKDAAAYKNEIVRGFLNQIAPLSEPLPFPRDVATFPGAVDSATPRVSRTIALDLSELGQASNLRMTSPRDWQATDLYVAAGDVFQVVLPEDLPPKQARQITIRIGAQCDKLQLSSINVKNSHMKRMPIITEEFTANPGTNHFRSQYGGNLIFTFEDGEFFTAEAEVHNVVEAPYFRLSQTSADEWEVSRARGAPQAVLESDKVVLVVRSSDASELPCPDELMKRYDYVVDKMNFLAGFSLDDPPPRGKFWLVNDLQIIGGSAHAGFPLMFDFHFYNLASLDMPHHWCVWHELGHNYQQGFFWSNVYGSEATANLFSLFVQEQLFGTDRLKENGDYQKAADAIDSGQYFKDCSSWHKLVFLMEIKHAFPDKGWEMFRRLHQRTRRLSEQEAERLASDRQLQLDYVYRNLSKIAESDLILTFQRWGFCVSQEAHEEVQGLGLEKAKADLSLRA